MTGLHTTAILTPPMREAVEKYREGRGLSRSGAARELIREGLERVGMWPPKGKEGRDET